MARIVEGISGVLSSENARPVLSWTEGKRLWRVYPEPRSITPHLRGRETGEIAVVFDLVERNPIHIRPANRPWCVLVSVLGGTPAVITETLQELLRREFCPDEIVIFTTTEGEKRLDPGFDRALCDLCAEAGAAVPDYRPIELLRDAHGTPLSDIRTDSDNIAAANVIANRVRELTRYSGSVVHASVAGGRKTMGSLLSDAMSLFGRPIDTVSHVLVQPEEAERAANFFYRPRQQQPLCDRFDRPIEKDGRALTTDDVSLDLANKPFFRLRGLVDEPVLHDMSVPLDFAAVMTAVNATVNPPTLILHSPGGRGEIEIVGVKRFTLDATHYALFRVAAEATAGSLSPIGPENWLTPEDFRRSAAVASARPRDKAEVRNGLTAAGYRYVELLKQLRYSHEGWPGFLGSEFWDPTGTGSGAALWDCREYQDAIDYINPIITRLNDALAANIGFTSVARLYQVERRGRRPMRFRLACDPMRIILN
jgi:CRISPR-associated protein (TIGR02584 family)